MLIEAVPKGRATERRPEDQRHARQRLRVPQGPQHFDDPVRQLVLALPQIDREGLKGG
eukprot:CAMPEP_0174293766 /NCGR_PEP_ID=MMETSP0809-20121228/39643_1 /TAXON_ID=73025 ORGANISM="Eutreptiella gymnastica-like, Strain CCMP1594" /NCGR_SAMPLE_ID=MMETSP0809 /ASSEMBLY_ACC=CAM_ASM_000658 /LENGTH=57 /DNA_ID=CAMNT_0015394795 /DNA_START=99 /DNA_END=269 /DNA_ORIENTATION=+